MNEELAKAFQDALANRFSHYESWGNLDESTKHEHKVAMAEVFAEPTNTGKLFETALAVRQCAESWEPSACLLGNVRADEIVAMARDYARLRLMAGVAGKAKKGET